MDGQDSSSSLDSILDRLNNLGGSIEALRTELPAPRPIPEERSETPPSPLLPLDDSPRSRPIPEPVEARSDAVAKRQPEDVPIEDASIEDAPIEDASIEGAPIEDVPIEDAPIEVVDDTTNTLIVPELMPDADDTASETLLIAESSDGFALGLDEPSQPIGATVRETTQLSFPVIRDIPNVSPAPVDISHMELHLQSGTIRPDAAVPSGVDNGESDSVGRLLRDEQPVDHYSDGFAFGAAPDRPEPVVLDAAEELPAESPRGTETDEVAAPLQESEDLKVLQIAHYRTSDPDGGQTDIRPPVELAEETPDLAHPAISDVSCEDETFSQQDTEHYGDGAEVIEFQQHRSDESEHVQIGDHVGAPAVEGESISSRASDLLESVPVEPGRLDSFTHDSHGEKAASLGIVQAHGLKSVESFETWSVQEAETVAPHLNDPRFSLQPMDRTEIEGLRPVGDDLTSSSNRSPVMNAVLVLAVVVVAILAWGLATGAVF